MAWLKTLMIQNKTTVNAWWDNMIGIDNVISEWIENFKLSQPNPSLFRLHVFLLSR